MQSVGINSDRKTTHSLRHTATTNAAKQLSPQKVREMTRHENLETVLVYYHEIGRFDDPTEDYIDYGE